MNEIRNKKVSTWKLSIVVLLLVTLSVISRVHADQPETLTLYEMTESNFPDGDGFYTYDLTEMTSFYIDHAPTWQTQLENRLEEGYDFEPSVSIVTNITIEALTLKARNWTDYFVNASSNYTIINQDQIMFIELYETDIDFTRTLSENESVTVEVLDQFHKFYRTFIFQMIPSDYGISTLEGFLKLKMTVVWELRFLIWPSVPTESTGDPIMAVPIIGIIGIGLLALVYFFREEK